MIEIVRATSIHAEILATIGKSTFLDAHGHSAPEKDIAIYTENTYSIETVITELQQPKNIYHLLFYKGKIAGYSKIVLDTPFNNLTHKKTTKLDRIYFLKDYYGLNLSKTLFDFNVKWARQHHQIGIWLAVWVNNLRAIKFYTKIGFEIIGEYDFNISKTHSNPNHIMYLEM